MSIIHIRLDSLDIGNYLDTYWSYMVAVTASLLANLVTLTLLILLKVDIPRSIYIMVAMLDIVLIGGVSFSYRIFRRLRRTKSRRKDDIRVLIIGAGDVGALILSEIRNLKP